MASRLPERNGLLKLRRDLDSLKQRVLELSRSPRMVGGAHTHTEYAATDHTHTGYAAATHTHSAADLTATGTRDATTYLRGDNTWATIPAPTGGVPTGTVAMYAGATAPAGYLLCQGQQVLIADYQDLYSVVGTTYGPLSGDGLKFTLPDLRSRFPIGAGTFAARGNGDTTAETSRTPQHSHVVNPGGAHQHNGPPHDHTAGTISGTPVSRGTGGLNAIANPITGSTGQAGGGLTTTDGSHNHGGTTDVNGPYTIPFLALNFIIKT